MLAAVGAATFAGHMIQIPPRLAAETAERIAELTPAVMTQERNVGIEEAVAFATSGQWGMRLMNPEAGELMDFDAALNQVHQMAADANLRIWGKRTKYGAYQLIPPEYWVENRICYLSIACGISKTEAHRPLTREAEFSELMANAEDFERCFHS